nr:ComEC/Rec2 family competence protein [Modestobacter sp. Leaf380]
MSERWTWLDLRLVPPALAVWATTLVLGGRTPAAAAGLLLVAVLTAALVARRAGRLRWTVVSVLAGVATAAVVGTVGGLERTGSPLVDLGARGAVATVVLTVDEEPRVLAGGPGPPRVLVAGTVIGLPQGPALRPATVLVFGPADEWRQVSTGSQVEVRATVRPPEPGDDVVAVLSARSPPTSVRGPGPAQAWAGDLRGGLAAASQRVLPDREAGLLPGLVVGDTSAMDPGVTADFRRAGLGHLTAVSGANVAIVLALLLWPLRRRAVSRRWQAAVGAAGLAGFVVLAGPSPSVVRAAAMGAVALLALATGRPRAAVPALAASVVVLLLLDPGLARDGGFALSVAATAGIVLLAPGWSRALRRRGLPGPLADALAVSGAAGLVTAPLVAGLSGLVSLVSLPANLLAAPAVAPATVLGLAATLLSPLSSDLADACVWAAGWPTRWLVGVAEHAAAVPDGATGWPTGTGGALLLAGLLVGGAAVLVRWPRARPLAVAAVVGVVVLGWPAREATRGWPVPGSVLVGCDVGQGDALVVPTGPGEGVLVDAGPDATLVDACLTRLGIDRLPLVLLSHLDADHVTGLAGALAGREVGEVATGVLSPTDDRVGSVGRVVAAAGGRLTVLAAGDTRTQGPATFDVLAPAAADAVPSADPNGLSMVVRVTHHGLRLLLTGDLGEDTESRLLARGIDLRADVLKVPHHGSGDADPDFLAATGARVALVSVGADNGYGHPAPRLLDWLAADGMRVLRTDLDGDVAVTGERGDWGTAVRGVDDVARAVALGPGPPGTVPATSRGVHRRRVGPSVLRDTMRSCPAPRRRPPPPGCGSWSARRSCCGRGRSPPSVRPPWSGTRAPRSTSWWPWGCRPVSWPTCWLPRCSAGTGWWSCRACTRPPVRWSTRCSATRGTPTPS